jgi:hypothetical protein
MSAPPKACWPSPPPSCSTSTPATASAIAKSLRQVARSPNIKIAAPAVTAGVVAITIEPATPETRRMP